ncbi:MAG: RluA family pseudouridine synthase [Chitinophagales bacterium]
MSETEENNFDELENDVFLVDKGQSPLRIDKYIISKKEHVSRSKIKHAAEAGCILVNGEAVKQNYKVRPFDKIILYYPKSKHVADLTPQDIPLDILYEDKEVLVINKPAGLVVHSGIGNTSGTLVNALLFHIGKLAYKDDETRAGLVHRLDKDTSGVMVVAKTDEALRHLSKQFFDRTIQRRYNALVWGDFNEEEGTVEGNIGRDKRNQKIFTVYPRGEYGKKAITHYKVLERFSYLTLVECKLETGRTHQIRVHMKHIGHTLFSDASYGGDKILKGTIYSKYRQFVNNAFNICPRQALHAKSLGFIHPKTGEEMYFEKELPEDMENLIEKWRKYTKTIFDS